MSNRRVWALTILLSGLMHVPCVWGSIPARLQAAAAARNPANSRIGQLSDNKSAARLSTSASAPQRTPRSGSAQPERTTEAPSLAPPQPDLSALAPAQLGMTALDGPETSDETNMPTLEPAADELAPALEPVPLESPLEGPSSTSQDVPDNAKDASGDVPAPQKLAPQAANQSRASEPTRAPAAAKPSKPAKAPTQPGTSSVPKSDTSTAPPAAEKTAKTFSPEMTRLRNRIRTCLSYYFQHATSVDERSPWGIMHSLIAFGVDTELVAGNQRVNAIGWLCYNRPCKGMTLMTVKDGRLTMRQNGPGYQGHDGQLLSMLALSGVKSNYPMKVEGHDFTVADLVAFEQLQCKPKSELTFQLIGLAHYLPSDATWEDKDGGDWSIPRMIREELAQPVNGAACGGTHRLIGLSMAAKTRQKRGEPLDGEWARAHKFVTSYQQHAFKLQNRDGSFSTAWLERRDDSGDVDRRIQTSGHILEWLVFSLPEKDLTDPRLVKGISYLANTLMDNERDWEIGPRGHALRALALYNERVFGDKPGQRRELLARRPGK